MNNNIEQPEVKEFLKAESEKIKEKTVFTDDEKKLKFYEKLRRNILKFVKNKTSKKTGKFTEYLLTLPDFFILLCRLAIDERVTKTQKLLVGGIIGYVIMPIDIIPDFIPIIGYVDDLVLVVLGLNLILNELDQQIIFDNWSGEEDVLELLQKITAIAENFLDKNILGKIKHLLSRIRK
ncbi:MAG TPA: DUF1232 domain-containing protein [Candidatus Cloacimonetes bacterium]|nr:DUF1232 domain-containing protein [Candidatus Cloacimonadota bacterium]